jgi:hypothetical protein
MDPPCGRVRCSLRGPGCVAAPQLCTPCRSSIIGGIKLTPSGAVQFRPDVLMSPDCCAGIGVGVCDVVPWLCVAATACRAAVAHTVQIRIDSDLFIVTSLVSSSLKIWGGPQDGHVDRFARKHLTSRVLRPCSPVSACPVSRRFHDHPSSVAVCNSRPRRDRPLALSADRSGPCAHVTGSTFAAK